MPRTLIVVAEQGKASQLILDEEVLDSPLHIVDMEPDLFTINDVQSQPDRQGSGIQLGCPLFLLVMHALFKDIQFMVEGDEVREMHHCEGPTQRKFSLRRTSARSREPLRGPTDLCEVPRTSARSREALRGPASPARSGEP